MANTPSGTRTAQDIKTKAQEAASGMAEKAQEAASGMTERAKEMASAAAGSARDVASNLGQRAEDATAVVGGGMKSLAGTLRENAPREGTFGSATSSVADVLERGGEYLQEEGLSGMAEDVTNLVRRYPIPALLIGIGIGFLLARTTSSRSY
jgi:hypothetical protein